MYSKHIDTGKSVVRRILLVGASLCLLAISQCCYAAPLSDFEVFSLSDGRTTVMPGRLYVPPEASTAPRPLIVFMHGAGESGTNNSAQVNGNIDNLLAEAKRRGAYLYAPQTNNGWSSVTMTDRVASMVDRALIEKNVDANRVYVTGLSMGGGGTWNMLNRHGDRFAAGVPICGISPTSFSPSNLVDHSVWAFHARNDNVVSVGTSRSVVSSILSAAQQSLPSYPTSASAPDFSFASPALDLQYTEFATGGHGIWGRVYSQASMYEWLFAHALEVPEPTALAMVSLAALLSSVGRRVATHRSTPPLHRPSGVT